jgi:dUTPase
MSLQLWLTVDSDDPEKLEYYQRQAEKYNKTPPAVRSMGFDLRLNDNVYAIAMKVTTDGIPYLPQAMHLVARSSTYKKFGIMLANGIGVIDRGYQGPIVAQWIQIGPKSEASNPRVSQLIPVEQSVWNVVQVWSADQWNARVSRFPSRGGGLGSTGVD